MSNHEVKAANTQRAISSFVADPATSARATPGPWIDKPTAGNHDVEVYAEASGRTIAVVYGHCSDAERDANGRLIAAAPLMAETLHFILDAYSRMDLADWNDEVVSEELTDIRNQAASLLAEIEGTE